MSLTTCMRRWAVGNPDYVSSKQMKQARRDHQDTLRLEVRQRETERERESVCVCVFECVRVGVSVCVSVCER